MSIKKEDLVSLMKLYDIYDYNLIMKCLQTVYYSLDDDSLDDDSPQKKYDLIVDILLNERRKYFFHEGKLIKKVVIENKDSIDHKKLIKNFSCDEIENIENMELLGRGTEGKVYLYCTVTEKNEASCPYVVKIEKKCDEFYLKKTLEISIKLFQNGIGPKIHNAWSCDDKCITLMDLVQGKEVSKIMYEKKFGITMAKKMMKAIEDMHKKIECRHGDLGFKNIFYNDKTKKFIFIDPGMRNSVYKPYYDYGTLLWYLPGRKPELSKNVINYMYLEVIEKLNSIKDEIEKDENLNEDDVMFFFEDLASAKEQIVVSGEIDQETSKNLKKMSDELFFQN